MSALFPCYTEMPLLSHKISYFVPVHLTCLKITLGYSLPIEIPKSYEKYGHVLTCLWIALICFYFTMFVGNNKGSPSGGEICLVLLQFLQLKSI